MATFHPQHSPQFLDPSAMARRVLLNWGYPSGHPLLQFSWNWIISFFWNFVWSKGPIWRCVWQCQMFFWKNPLATKMSKMAQKWGFGLFRKIYSFVFSRNSVEWRYLWPFMTVFVAKIWFSSYSEKYSQPIRFQCSLIVNISLMDWHLTLIFCM